MKKVLILTNHSFMLWQFRRELIAAMLESGREVVVSVPFGEHVNDFRAMGCRMIDTPLERRGMNPLRDVKLCRAYTRILREEKPDMVVTYSIKPNIYGGWACRRLRIPYCVNVQGLGTAFQKPLISQLVTAMYRVAVKKAKVVFFENGDNAAIFREKKITPAAQQKLLNGAGVNLGFYARQPYPDNNPIRFLYLGRIMREKGIDELFSAVRRLRGDGEKFVLDLVGFFEDGYKQEVQRLTDEGIAVFHGFQSDARPYYGAADCVVLPSYHEGMSNVLLEAAATGRPVITSDISGCREAVDPERSGFICPVRDAEELYCAMKRFLALGRGARGEMGLAGYRWMRAHFSKEEVIAETMQAILE